MLLAFTEQAAFQTAISGAVSQSTLDFEGLAGTTLASGDSVGGITFTFALWAAWT